MKLGYFWRFEIPGAIARLLPGNHEKPSSFFIFLLKEVRTRCGVAQERFRKAPQAKDVPRIFGNFKSPVSPHFHAAAHTWVMVPWHTPSLDRNNPKLSAPIRNFRF